MSTKSLIWIGATVGGLGGAYLPALWHAGEFSMWSVFLSTVGGIAGAIAGYKLGRSYF